MKLEIESVSKTYHGNVEALRSFRLELGPGVLGLLGPNGAGKSTLMRILAPPATALYRGTDNRPPRMGSRRAICTLARTRPWRVERYE